MTHGPTRAHNTTSTYCVIKLTTEFPDSHHKRLKEATMIDHDNLEDFRDAELYDLQDEGYYDDYPLTEPWAQAAGGPLLDLACGTGRMALRMAALGYQVTGVDITPEMIARARQKAAQQALSIDWMVADARTFHLQKQFSFIYM